MDLQHFTAILHHLNPVGGLTANTKNFMVLFCNIMVDVKQDVKRGGTCCNTTPLDVILGLLAI